MKLEKYHGYKFALRTTLKVEECRRLLMHEFYDAKGYWRHAASDKTLLGRKDRGEILVFLSTYSLYPPRQMRVCRIRLHSGANWTTITGSYSYYQDEGLLIGMTISLCLAIVFGILFVAGGIVVLFQDVRAFWLPLLGVVILAISIGIIRDASDDGFSRERDYIKSYLGRLLEAQEVPPRLPRHLSKKTGVRS